ncbi:MAG TPA: archaetidylserine decarboxylase [Vicinamibacteria bacterium]|nr:archaetidylserine decarboxylase [Vicinamibacteria bacterium]
MAPVRDILERRFVGAFANPVLSRPMARIADLRLPRPVLRQLIAAWVRAYKVDLSEIADPVDSYPTFNAFFTRRLREGARPIARERGTIVSPTDSRVNSIGAIPAGGRLDQVKGRSYLVEKLLGDPAEAALFASGVHATLYLSPAMYHRVHSPVDGRVRAWRYIPGRLFPVNVMAVRHVDGLFTVNERVVVHIDSEEFGRVAVIMVGAANVGRMTLAFHHLVTNRGGPPALIVPPEPIPIARGEELGAFNLGSTVVLLVAEPRLHAADVVEGDLVRMGQALWRRDV